jgi:WD40 repeat protein
LAFSADGKRLASAGVAGAVEVWDVAAGGKPITLQKKGRPSSDGRLDHVFALAFSADGRRLTWAGNDGTVKVWDLASSKVVRTFTSPHSMRLRGKEFPVTVSSVALSRSGTRFASGGGDGKIRVWDVDTGKARTLSAGMTPVFSLALSPDSRRLASASGGKEGPSTLRVWDLMANRLLVEFDGQAGVISHLAFSPDGKRLASANEDGAVRLWDVGHPRSGSGRELLSLRGPEWVRGLLFSPDGLRLALAGKDGMKIWNGTPGPEVFVFRKHPTAAGIHGVALSRDGRQLAYAGGNVVRLWEWADCRSLFHIPQEVIDVNAGDVHPSYCWDVALSPDGRQLAVASGNKRTGDVTIWDTATGRVLYTLRGHRGMVKAVAYGREGGRLFSAGWDGTVRAWDLATGKEVHRWEAHAAGVNGLAVSPDGGLIATAGKDGNVVLWATRTGLLMRGLTGHAAPATRVAFDASGRWLASAGSEGGEVRVWDMSSVACQGTFIHPGRVYGVAFSPDGKRLVTGGDDRLVRVWDVDSGQQVLALRGHLDSITRVAITPDGQFVVSASKDRTVRVWTIRPLPR